jgi:serine/threonine-protein kinase
VVLKALAKNPEQRYASAEALRLDLERWLDGEPVLAKAPSSAYQLHKFVQRNRWSVGLGAAAIVSLVAVATTAVFLGLQARDEAARALAARDFLIDLFGQADPDLSHGKDMTAKELLDQGRKTILSSMTGQPLLQADLMRGLGNAQANMSDYRKADASLAEAARLYEQMDLPEKVARTLIEQADAIYRSGDSQRAERILAGAAVQLREQNANAGTMTRYYEVLSLVELDNGDLSKAKLASEKSLSLATQAFGELDKRTIVALRAVARIEGRAGEFTLAIHRLEEALTRAEHTNNLVPQDRVEIQTELAETEYSAGRFDAAANRLEFAAARCEQLLDPNGESCWFLRQREMVVLFLQGRHQKALTLLPSMLTMAANAESPNRKAEALVTACRVLALNNRALEHPELWANLRLLGDSGQEVKQRESLKIQALFAQAEMLLHSEQPAASQDVLEHAEKRWKADSRANQRTGARLHLMQGLAFQALDQHEPALQSLRAGTAEYALLLGENHPLTVLMSANQARSLWATHRADEALALLDRAIPILRPALGADAPTFVHLLALRGELASTPTPNPRTARKVDFFL